MEQWQVALLSVAIGGLIGFGATLLTQWRLDARDKTVDKRRLRDAKLARVRNAFKVVLSAAWGMATAAAEMRWSWEGESEEQKRQRLDRLIGETSAGIDSARAELALEKDMSDILKDFGELYAGFIAFSHAMVATPEQYGGVEERAKARKKNDEKINAGAAALEKKLRERIEALEGSV